MRLGAIHRIRAPARSVGLWRDARAAGWHVCDEAGFADEWRDHHPGGPAGYGARDFKATPDERRMIAVNQAIAWNPSITGARSEVATTSSGEVLPTIVDRPMGEVATARPDVFVRRP